MLDTFRVILVVIGGAIIGGGTAVLLERVRFYRRAGLPKAVHAMKALIVVNILTLTFIALVMYYRWGEDLSIFLPLGAAVFLFKALFFQKLRATGIEQERRLMESGAPSWINSESAHRA